VEGKNEKTSIESRGEERTETLSNVKKFDYRKHFVVMSNITE